MSLTLQTLINNGFLDELASCFTDATNANLLLTSIDFPVSQRPNFNRAGSPIDFWYEVCEKIEKGFAKSGFEELLKAAARRLPGNKTFAPLSKWQASPAVSPAPSTSGNFFFPIPVIRHYDVFISYSRLDQDIVRCIAQQLRDRNVKVWLDEWELPVGVQFVPEIEKVLDTVPAVAVFYGPNGFGPWQKTEVYSVYDRAFKNKCKLIPVLLPGVKPSDLPLFLKTFNSITISSCADRDSNDKLAYTISGKK